jgi:hypothetical protein
MRCQSHCRRQRFDPIVRSDLIDRRVVNSRNMGSSINSTVIGAPALQKELGVIALNGGGQFPGHLSFPEGALASSIAASEPRRVIKKKGKTG